MTESLNIYKHKGLKNNSSLICVCVCVFNLLYFMYSESNWYALNKASSYLPGFMNDHFLLIQSGKIPLAVTVPNGHLYSLRLVLLLQGTFHFSSVSTEDLNNENRPSWIFLSATPR